MTGVALQRAGHCRGCGACCERIFIPRGFWDWSQKMATWVQEGGAYDPAKPDDQNAQFVTAHWTPIEDDGSADTVRVRCDAYDPVTRRCMQHFNRPPVCRDYPWYGGPPLAGKLYASECGYWLDLPTDERPADFDLVALARA